jgi:UDP-N-acetylmuramoylalanine-D-glutamate ligase
MKNLSSTRIGDEKLVLDKDRELKIKIKFFEAQTALEAFQIASRETKSAGVVLLSPAGEGFFSKFLNRRTGGMSLKKILEELKK